MTIYIDELTEWKPNQKSAHLGSNESVEELYMFADNMGFPRNWLQDKDYFHYDVIGVAKYNLALKLGAQQVSSKEWIKLVPRKTSRRQKDTNVG